ncbi:transposase [Aggregatibacter actinomycetemcomitans]|uniref:transposase n=1 Tax=Aggregatibacter actinomycetemcomitans TaxID=714 RepID=UPI00197CAFA4|nr:transposase [Aggregatibacter actinomycetemcomitans]MBN6076451.1 transposase [Aggregatibacter actinomycetemcomitans]
MRGLRIDCPECGKALNIRNSMRPSACLTQAIAYCYECRLRVRINANLDEVSTWEFSPVADNHIWQQDKNRAQQRHGKK